MPKRDLSPAARRTRFRRAAVAFGILAVLGVVVWRVWYTPPPETQLELYQGVRYERRVVRLPRPAVVHLLRIETDTPGLRFLVTPPDNPGAEHPLQARKTSEFLREHRVQAAINVDFFSPWWSNTPLDYYPHARDPVGVEGDAVTEGKRYSARSRGAKLATVYLGKDNRPSLDPPKSGALWNVVSGHPLLRDGTFLQSGHYALHTPDPRTALAWTPDGKVLYWIIVDGRQRGYSEGMTLKELAEFVRTLGVRDAVNLDGGGSSVLVVSDGNNEARILSRPIDQHIPGKERYVANHLGLYAPPLPR